MKYVSCLNGVVMKYNVMTHMVHIFDLMQWYLGNILFIFYFLVLMTHMVPHLTKWDLGNIYRINKNAACHKNKNSSQCPCKLTTQSNSIEGFRLRIVRPTGILAAVY